MSDFSTSELERYSRQILLFGRKGQEKLKKARVGLVGLGGLGCPALLYLSAAGVGYIRIAEFDIVECHNLSRQILFSQEDCGQRKDLQAQKKINQLNPNVTTALFGRLHEQNMDEFAQDLHLILEGSDNLELKFFLNDACYASKIPLIIGALGPEQGHVFPVFYPHACYRCVFVDVPSEEIPTCASAGVISPMAGTLGSMMASLAVQFLAMEMVPQDLLVVEKTRWRSIPLKLNPRCPHH
ncbi:MAG: HesA/MoeB/ThiF family protein [Leptospiraceae bacterium]|nr:HesA/MoeB/ThiF family protein [Leptospiraceae bacterium]MDW8306715.1 HesA/MoeB/ThiF family protein [Leptospiraceae bacterium]